MGIFGKSSFNTMLRNLYVILVCVIPWTYCATTLPLIWQDEFDGTALDTSKWNIITGNLGVNEEHQYYQGDNLEVSGGYLVITARKETMEGQNYTSGRIDGLNKFSTKYGRIEARLKLPMVTGSWPAFWMLGDNFPVGGWPQCGELDIMEHVNTETTIMGTLHWYNNGQADYGTTTTISTPGDWHIYATEWDSQSIKIFVDDTQYFVRDYKRRSWAMLLLVPIPRFSTTPVQTTTIVVSTTTGPCTTPPANADCQSRSNLIGVSMPANTTILTNTLTQHYNTWDTPTKAGFNTYFNMVRKAIWDNAKFPDTKAKITEIVADLKKYNFNNAAKQKVLMDIIISEWNCATIKQFCDCGDE
ncbi:glycosyl hydrolases family 16 domain-containing protein [Ditylenchus destructor]|uniref:Glycosyl hydrolases family 16 domain-containing protein n=1 Tax=Ditylenchus destructor TaxID=166010 RepID=A0AAD4MVA1_9BILA|nr:glycosyl hydrolases family 16 domain-containing protein [Ditylenchus destructor]